MIVIDASALAKFVLKEGGWRDLAEHLKAGTVSADHAIKEVANAVWKRFKRGAISLRESELMLNALERLVGNSVIIEDESAHMGEAIRIAFSRDIAIYDAIYIAIAKHKDLALLTADERQAEAAKGEGVMVIRIDQEPSGSGGARGEGPAAP